MVVNDMHELLGAVCQIGEWGWNSREIYCVNTAEFAVEVLNIPSLRNEVFSRPDLSAIPGWTRR